jgi:hypothetical protein
MGYQIDAEKFVNHYESNGWHVGKNKMVNWHCAIATWVKNDPRVRGSPPIRPDPPLFDSKKYEEDKKKSLPPASIHKLVAEILGKD